MINISTSISIRDKKRSNILLKSLFSNFSFCESTPPFFIKKRLFIPLSKRGCDLYFINILFIWIHNGTHISKDQCSI